MKNVSWLMVIVTGLMAVGSVVGPAAVEAALLTYDGFDYPVGETLDGKDGGTGWDGVSWGQFLGGAAGLDIVADSLTDPTGTLQRSGNHVQTNSQQFSGRYPLLPNYGADGTTTYYSILLRPDADSDPGADDWYGLQLFNNAGQGDVFIGKGGAMTNYGLENFQLGINDESSLVPTVGETVLLVTRVDFTSADDTFSLYINPTPGGPEPAVADAILTFDLGTQNGLAMNSGGGAQISFDEIRIGETFADVTPVPEPASLVLLGLAWFLVAGSRSKRPQRPGRSQRPGR